MSSIKMIPRVLNLQSGNPSLMKGILRILSRGHHQVGVTVNVLPWSNSQARSLAPSGSFFIKQTVKPGLVTYPQKCLPFTCDVSRSRTFSSTTGDVQPGKISSSQTNETYDWKYLRGLLKFRKKYKDVQLIEEELKKLDEMGIKINQHLDITLLMKFYCRQGNLKKTMHYKTLIADFPTYSISDALLIDIATLLTSSGQFEEAEKLILEHSPRFKIENSKSVLSNSVYKFFSAIGSSGDIGRTRKMLELLLKKGYYSGNPPNEHLEPLVKIHLEKNDIDGAVEEIIQAIEKYKCTPCLGLIFQALIEKSETERLQKVVNAASKVHGESQVLLDLAKAYLQLNNSTKTLEILKTSDVRLPERELNSMLEHLVLGKKIETLEEFVKLSKDLADVNRDLMYYHLFKGYILEKNLEKVLEAWKSMKDEGVNPSKYTLHHLGKFLTEMGQEVPFQFHKKTRVYTFKDTISDERVNAASN